MPTALAAPQEQPAPAAAEAEPRPRIRDLGVSPGILPPGPLDAITDVAGVRVGHRTLIRGDEVRTGITAIVPHGGNLFQQKVPAAVWVANGFGKAAGFLQVRELGVLETPVVLTNTLAVGAAVEGVVAWSLAQPGNEQVRSVNAVVGETNDGWLNDIRGLHVRPADVRAAIDAAAPGPVAEGSVGAGTGTRALGFKGGIGTASRKLPAALGGWTVGALVQTNFGGVLTIDGVRVGERLGRYAFRDELAAVDGSGSGSGAPAAPDAGAQPDPDSGASAGGSPTAPAPPAASEPPPGEGSCMIVLATDAPLSPRDLERLAGRAVLGLGRVGSFVGHGSGDYVVAFSTAYRVPYEDGGRPLELPPLVHDGGLDPLFLAAVETVEEAIYNSLTRATTVTGFQGREVEAIPLGPLRELLAGRR
jgi:D-aminopeptidase